MPYTVTESSFNNLFKKELVVKVPNSNKDFNIRYYKGLIALLFKCLGLTKTLEGSNHKFYCVNRKQYNELRAKIKEPVTLDPTKTVKQIRKNSTKTPSTTTSVPKNKTTIETPPTTTPIPKTITSEPPLTPSEKELKNLKKIEFETSKFWKICLSEEGSFSQKYIKAARELYLKNPNEFDDIVVKLIHQYHNKFPIDADNEKQLSLIKLHLKKEITLQFEDVFGKERKLELSKEKPPTTPEPLLKQNFSKIPSTIHTLPGNKKLQVYSTRGDGSCGLHALLGEPKSGQVVCPDVSKKRNEFVDWLSSYRTYEPTKEEGFNFFKIVTDDFFLDFSKVPQGVKTKEVLNLYKEKRKEFDQLESQVKKINEQIKNENDSSKKVELKKQLTELYNRKDQINIEFRDSDVVFKAYQNDLRKTNTFLLQEELIAAAKCFKKNLVICQPCWSSAQATGVQRFNFGEENDPPAYVWYNGFNHYEMGKLVEE